MVILSQRPRADTLSANDTEKTLKKEMDVNVIDGLKWLYESRVLPLERHYLFDEFHSPPLEASYFEAKPSILMVGQYSPVRQRSSSTCWRRSTRV